MAILEGKYVGEIRKVPNGTALSRMAVKSCGAIWFSDCLDRLISFQAKSAPHALRPAASVTNSSTSLPVSWYRPLGLGNANTADIGKIEMAVYPVTKASSQFSSRFPILNIAFGFGCLVRVPNSKVSLYLLLHQAPCLTSAAHLPAIPPTQRPTLSRLLQG